MEIKEELELLLNNFFITKEQNREAYYKIKSKIKKLREFTTNKLGCDILVNSSFIKLEKIPSHIDSTFQIEAFNHPKDYILYLLIIMFLEDKAADEQFILSDLTTFITNVVATFPHKETTIDFKDFSTRKSLVDVMKYVTESGIIKKIDGDETLFKDVMETEALYENTGISHYLIRQFKEDIFSYKKPEDFLNTMNTEEQLSRKRYYTYRTLLFYPVFHFADFDAEIYNYFINYRNRIMSDISDVLDGDLLVYDNMALLTTTEKNNRTTFPNSRKMLHDIILLVHDYIQKELDRLKLTRFEFEQLLKKIQKEKGMYFSKEYREMKETKFAEEVITAMEKFGLLRVRDDICHISPVVYLLSGNYPEVEEQNDTYEQISLEVEV